ncbi:gliding motility-associated C-terminal domain-containing protein [Flavitalea sp. BT771]|uniref:T9SS type B sorting domain-containing protein n=1 Tax=Flavitalea sp. BT771 TaxID=3063329 RepID=UPI0026E3D79D|nr:T9SS type B sorting domain-containing protein [Flavitalea sp. BT771]MDO6429594.1 gliding motility-associated C-terminal domain-containing protein [Flavitalea sp. BT771]MDV6218278.1 gliding motility-associated C-terminal domain-containing protein [Flavitalea sp. BT771]
MPVKILLLFLLVIFPFIIFGQRPPRRNVPLAGPCTTTNAEKIYGGLSDDYAANIMITSDGGYLMYGYTNSFGNGGYDGYVVKFDNLGVIQWSRTYGGPGDDEFGTGKQTSDGGYILGGYTTSYGDPAGDAWLVKIDAAGNMLWSKKYGDGNPNGDRLFDLIQTADGGYAFCGDHKYTPGVVDAMVVRTDATGNLLWAKGFESGGSDESVGILEDKDSLVVTAFYQSFTGYDGVLMKIEETTGTISWLKSWDFDNRTNRMGNIYLQPDGYIIGGVNSDGFGLSNPYENVMKTDFNGNIIYVQELRTTPNTMNGYFRPTSDGGYIIENDELITDPNADIYFTKVAKDGTIEWSRRYPQPGQQIMGGIMPTPDGGYAGLATTNQTGNVDFLLIKTDATGQTGGCTNVAVTGANRNPVVTDLLYSWPGQYDIVFDPSLTINPVVTTPATKDSLLCQTVNVCVDLKLNGSDSICNFSDTISYKATRDPGCVSPVQWTVDNTYANIIAQTDSTIQLQFKQPGSVKLYGKIINPCAIVEDSIIVQIFTTTPIDLGNPASICPGDSIVLDAGSGFQSYAWSTGDISQQIVVKTQGNYWVAAVNPIGLCLSRDTIAIGVYPKPSVNIGPDTSICRDSVYIFNAGSGFSNYLWQDGSSDSVLYTSLPGIYWVSVTDQNGCSTSDSARILRINENPKDFLEPAAEICSQGQLPLQLNAIGIYRSYLWSDSSAGPAITIAAPGQYWLQVTNAAGCTAKDTISVIGKACPIGIFFPGAFTPNNDGNNDVYRAIVYTVLDKFYMAIYDRWGVRVFQTSDPNKGWDGMFNGHPQPAGTFVWYAQYQLHSQHGKEIVQKGTLLLVR